jgi:Tfp pilus assembly protein PilO
MTAERTTWAPWGIDAAGALLCAAATAVAYFGGVRPFLTGRAAFARQQQQLAEKRRQAAELSASVASAQQQLAAAHKALEASRVRLQPASTVNGKIAWLTRLVGECRLETHNIEVGQAKRGARYDTVAIVLTGSGRYPDCAAFITRLCAAAPDTGVASFTLSGRPEQTGAEAAFRFELVWYAAGGSGAEDA